MVNIIITHSAQSRPSMSIRVIRVLPDTAPLFTFARSGGIASIRSLFQQGLCSPKDVAASDGRSALQIAIYSGRAETAKFLVHQHADVEYEVKYFVSAVGACWKLSFQNLTVLEPCTIGKSRDDDDYLDESTARVDYRLLHKIVLGIASLPLEKHLEYSAEEINCQDAGRKTPLHWASVRGDTNAMQILLDFGADPNSLSNAHWTPIHPASMPNIPEGLEILLKHGPRINERNNRSDTAMSIICPLHDDDVCLDILHKYGADVHTTNNRRETTLHRASFRDHSRTVRWLLAHGVDINSIDATGCTAFHQCVKNGSRRTMELLLEAGCCTGATANDGRTILHDSAAFAGVEMLSLLNQYCVDPIDLRPKIPRV